MKTAGSALSQIIQSVKPILSRCCEHVKNIDAIECAKDKMLEGEELMTTGKFSAPGKYRRNMNQLKKCTKHVNQIELETSKILQCLQTEALQLAQESAIVAEQRNTDQDLDDIFSNLSQESIPIVLSECDENFLDDEYVDERPATPLPTIDLLVSPDISSDHEVDNVFNNVYYENDDACQDSIQVSKEISNSTGLDFHVISTNIQHPSDSIGNDEDDLLTPPQVHFHENDLEQSVNGNICHELEYILPGVESNAPESDQNIDPKQNSNSSNSSNSCEAELDFLPGDLVSHVENQSPPLSEDIIQPVNTDEEGEIIATEESLLKDCNKSNFEEVFTCSNSGEDLLSEEDVSIEVIMKDETYEEVKVENTQDISNANHSINSNMENVGSCDPLDQQSCDYPLDSGGDSESIIAPVNELQVEQEPDELESGIDYINISASTPQTKQIVKPSDCLSDDSDGIVLYDIACGSDELTQLSMSEGCNIVDQELLLSDSSEEIETERIKGQDTAAISIDNKSDFSPDVLNISSTKVTFEGMNTGDNVDDVTEEPLHSDSSVSGKGLNNQEEVDVALMVLKEAISNDDIQDEFVDLLCSSISRVLGDEEEKSPIIVLNSKSSSLSSASYEESTVHKSFQHSREVLDWVGTHFQNNESYNYDNVNSNSQDKIKQCIVVPVEKDSVHSPIIISHTILKSEKPTKVCINTSLSIKHMAHFLTVQSCPFFFTNTSIEILTEKKNLPLRGYFCVYIFCAHMYLCDACVCVCVCVCVVCGVFVCVSASITKYTNPVP